MALLVFFFSKRQTRTCILRHILGYIRILTRIWPKKRILTSPDYYAPEPEEDRIQEYDPGYGARPGGW